MREFGFEQCANVDELRRRFHEIARGLHPDVCNEPGASAQFRALVAAYRLERRKFARLSPAAVQSLPRRAVFRWGCAACGDSYAEGHDCPRCERPLHDTLAGEPIEPVQDDAVNAMIERLERPPRPASRWTPEQGLSAASLFLAALGGYHWLAGMKPLGLMMLVFALTGVAAQIAAAYRQANPASWMRWEL